MLHDHNNSGRFKIYKMTDSGVCFIKPEFIVPEHVRTINLSHVSEKDKSNLVEKTLEETNDDPPAKRLKLSKSQKKKLKGQNKSRGPTFRVEKSTELCNTVINIESGDTIPECNKNNCQFIHDFMKYLETKPKDIGDSCYNYKLSGKCSRGLACRFGKEHISPDGRNIIDKDKYLEYEKTGPHTKNQLKNELQISLKKRSYNFDLAEKLVNFNQKIRGDLKQDSESDKLLENNEAKGSITDEDIIKLLKREKKQINWKNKVVLSPLTTVGNLPFRRICKEFGADITCGEMAMCTSLLKGLPQEWALVKRHESEDIFGVQLCANNPYLLTKCGQLLEKETEIDFIDLNLGCPIELVYQQGGGCGMLRRQNKLENSIRSMSDILTIPFTVKTRTGIHINENLAHTLAPKFREWGVSAMTIHGRSREQRYTKTADWAYIKEVVGAASPLPVIGNGDILSYEDYKNATEFIPDMAGVMIGRGALIKPWIFSEIKEAKLWDISSSERFDILKKFSNYGLEHWGSDNKGVENTRRFLLEWLSFLYRYVPVGILERPPQKINQRPPVYKGRDDLETLMASPSASDWIKISEMLLGPVPENFKFLPKHKANSYG